MTITDSLRGWFPRLIEGKYQQVMSLLTVSLLTCQDSQTYINNQNIICILWIHLTSWTDFDWLCFWNGFKCQTLSIFSQITVVTCKLRLARLIKIALCIENEMFVRGSNLRCRLCLVFLCDIYPVRSMAPWPSKEPFTKNCRLFTKTVPCIEILCRNSQT